MRDYKLTPCAPGLLYLVSDSESGENFGFVFAVVTPGRKPDFYYLPLGGYGFWTGNCGFWLGETPQTATEAYLRYLEKRT